MEQEKPPWPFQWLLLHSKQGARPRLLILTRKQVRATGVTVAKPIGPAVVSAQPARLSQILKAAEESGADLVLIDTPPRAERAALDAARAAHLVLVPCRPSIFDLETFSTTRDLVAAVGSKPLAAVLNAVPTRGKKRQQAEQALKELNITVCPEVFGDRVAFDHANTAGLSAQEYEAAGKAAAEIQNVYMSVCRLVDMSKRGVAHGKS